MTRIKVFCFIFSGLFLLGVSITSSAFAEGEFLANGSSITAELPIRMAPSAANENLLLEDMNAIGTPDVLCSLIMEGTVEVGGKLLFHRKTKTLAGVEKANSVECVDDKSTCSSPVIVTSINLPSHFEIKLIKVGPPMEWLGTYLFETNKNWGFKVDCNTILGLVEDSCEVEEAGTNVRLTNEAAGLLAEFSENEEITPPLKCSVGGAKQGLVAGDFIITEPNGATLTVSE